LNVTCTELAGLTDQAAVDFLLRRGAIVEPPSQLGREPLAGFLYAGASFGSIFVERNDLVVRRRFSAAHELGHYLCHFRPFLSAIENDGEPMLDSFPIAEPEAEPGDLPVGEINAPGVMEFFGFTFEQMEREANQFAAELLIPGALVTDLGARYAPYFVGEDLVSRLASDMLVSRAAMRWRLRRLGLLSPEQARWN
jgi:Zn-dependent peptidase ImmA (M78 family)